MQDFILNWLVSIPVFATPILLTSLGLIITVRAGILNLGAEGIMAVAAMAGVVVVLSGYPLGIGLAAAVISGMAVSLVFGISTIYFKTDQVLTGLLLVALGTGVSGVVGHRFTHQPIPGFDPIDFGLLSDIPIIGRLVFGHDLLVYLAATLVVCTWWGIHRTKIGLRLRAVGEDPYTADTSGTDVARYRLAAVLIGGAFCAAGGAYLSLAAGEVWVEHMVGGRGWVAVALAIFARWRPFPALGGAVIFAGAEAIVPRIQAAGIDFPVYVLLMLPYLLTLAVLILPYLLFKDWKDEAPAGLMRNYIREDRQ